MPLVSALNELTVFLSAYKKISRAERITVTLSGCHFLSSYKEHRVDSCSSTAQINFAFLPCIVDLPIQQRPLCTHPILLSLLTVHLCNKKMQRKCLLVPF